MPEFSGNLAEGVFRYNVDKKNDLETSLKGYILYERQAYVIFNPNLQQSHQLLSMQLRFLNWFNFACSYGLLQERLF